MHPDVARMSSRQTAGANTSVAQNSPTAWCSLAPCVVMVYTGPMNEDWWRLVGVLVLLSPIVFVLLWVLYTQVQVHLLEFMLTLIVSTLPMDLLLASTKDSRGPDWNEARAALLGFFPMLIIIAGSLWGLSAAKRMKEERTWHRLGLMLLGWTLVPSLACLLVGGIGLILSIFSLLNSEMLWAPALLPGSVPLFVAIAIERRCPAPWPRKPEGKDQGFLATADRLERQK